MDSSGSCPGRGVLAADQPCQLQRDQMQDCILRSFIKVIRVCHKIEPPKYSTRTCLFAEGGQSGHQYNPAHRFPRGLIPRPGITSHCILVFPWLLHTSNYFLPDSSIPRLCSESNRSGVLVVFCVDPPRPCGTGSTASSVCWDAARKWDFLTRLDPTQMILVNK